MEFILTIVGLRRRYAGNPDPVRLLFAKETPSRGPLKTMLLGLNYP
ncbi:hypothetical protein SAMN04487916_108151 [Arthrobacter sp. ov407]|nr:hypothetical protein SAMN04487916_108151 [Arthrobacter sp. ov407]